MVYLVTFLRKIVETQDIKYMSFNQYLERFISKYFGIMTVKFVNLYLSYDIDEE